MNRKRVKRGILVLVASLCMIGAIWLYLDSFVEEPSRLARENEAKRGSLEGLSEEELQELMDRKAEEGSLTISIGSELKFPSGTGKGNIRIENSGENRYLLVVEIYRKDNGERIYRSGAMEPGYYLERDRLEGNLDKGSYEVEIHFKAYDMESEEYIGESVVEDTVEILT